MPTYRSITISLISQYDILTIPEYAPPATSADPFSSAPTLVNTEHSLVSVYVPTYPASQFWLSYSIAPPFPPKLLYFFKLYLNGVPIVSWGCSEADGYKGKTMFGLFDSGKISPKRPVLQRRALCFAAEDDDDAAKHAADNLDQVIEVRVFRSRGRKRVRPQIGDHVESERQQANDQRHAGQQTGGGIALVNAGLLPRKHPQRFYKYALLDPLDKPFATFRYYYRSWEQLDALGVVSPTPSVDSSSIKSHIPTQQPLRQQSSNNTLTSNKSSSSIEKASTTTPEPVEASLNVVQPNPAASSSSTSFEESSTSSCETTRVETPPVDSEHANETSTPPASQPISPPKTTASHAKQPISQKATSKEAFTSLIRTRLSDPLPSTPNAAEPPTAANPDPETSTHPSHNQKSAQRPQASHTSHTGTIDALLTVVTSARNRRRHQNSLDSNPETWSDNSHSEYHDSTQGIDLGNGVKERISAQERDKGKGKAMEDSCGGKYDGRPKDKGGRRLNLWEQL